MSKWPKGVRRALAIKFNDGSPDMVLEISTASKIKTDKGLMILEERKDGTYMLNVTEGLIDGDFAKVESFEMIREN